MRPMRNVRQRGRSGIWYAVVDVPADARWAFEGRRQVWVSLRTRAQAEAIARAAPVIAEIKSRIASARSGQTSAGAIGQALERWSRESLSRSFRDYMGQQGALNGTAFQPWSLRLQTLFSPEPWEHEGFDDFLRDILSADGVQIGPDDPRLAAAREAFARIWQDVNTQHRLKFEEAKALSRAVFERAAETPTNATAALPPASDVKLTLTGLRDRFIGARGIEGKDASEIKAYVRRLTEFLGDLPIDQVTPEMLDRFKTSLRAFPVVKKPAVLELSFNEILRAYEGETKTPRLTTATIRRKWFGAFNRMFNYALELDLVSRNPVTKIIPKKSEEDMAERKPFSAQDIGKLFSAPLFTGHTGKRTGYRKEPGKVVTKDAAYWLPIISLWHGFRVEEMGGMRTAEVRQEEGVWVFDLTRRDLKTRESRRLVPIHPRMKALGFLEYVERQTGEWLFPDLPHDPSGQKAATRAYTSWFGRWCDEHGFTDPAQSFHSFRHTFKRACREAGVPEELHDLLTGHKGPPSVGRGYGRGVALRVLAREVAKVDYPTFPLRR